MGDVVDEFLQTLDTEIKKEENENNNGIKKCRAAGIDLGTTYCCVGIYRQKKVEIVPTDTGAHTMPSYVAFTNEGCYIGQSAKNQVINNSKNTIYDVKRQIGRLYDDPNVQNDISTWPFTIINCDNKPMIQVEWNGKTLLQSPEQISSLLLSQLKKYTEEYLGYEINDVVITVPAYFNDIQRQQTKEAGTIAKLNVLRIINEPTAAAIAYGIGICKNPEQDDTKNDNSNNTNDSNDNNDGDDTNDEEKYILVFDQGGGTFDVSLLSITGVFFEVRATAGDTHLGGEDFDLCMVKYVQEIFLRQNETKLSKEGINNIKNLLHNMDNKHKNKQIFNMDNKLRSLLRTLLSLCERAKCMLSTEMSAEMTLDNIYENLDLHCTITRSRFENLCEKLFLRCMEPIQQVLHDSKISKERINEILFVGGSSRIPKIRTMVSNYFNKKVNTSISPDEAVAYGAAVQACIITNDIDDITEDMQLVDVIPLSLGIKTAGDIMSVFIKRNSPIPVKITKFYSTDIDDQQAVDICIYEGERFDINENHFLGKVSLENIPKKPAGVPRIKVTFSLDQDGILDVSAIEQLSNTQCSIKLISGYGSGRLTYDDVQKILKDSEQFAKEDKYLRDIKRARLECETLCQQVKGSLPYLLSYIDDTIQLRILQALDDCNAWISVNSDASPEEFLQTRDKFLKKVDTYLNEAYKAYINDGGDPYPNGKPPELKKVSTDESSSNESINKSPMTVPIEIEKSSTPSIS